MKKLLFLILLSPFLGYSQTVITWTTADTTKARRTTGTTNAEVKILNGDRTVTNGIAYNASLGWIRYGNLGYGILMPGSNTFRVDTGASAIATKSYVNNFVPKAYLSATSPIFYSAGVISSQAASASLAGYVTTGTQTVAGAKTFTSSPVVATGGSSYLNITGGTSGSEAGLILNDGGTPKWQVIKGNSGNGHDLLFYNYNTGTTGFSLSSGANLATFGGNVIGGTYNGNTITTGTGVLTLGAGKTFTSSNTLTLTATDGSTLAIGAGGTLGTNAYTSTAYAPIASPTFTGTVTIPTPFTLGATSVTTTGTQLNLLAGAAGSTGTNTTNVVFSTSPTLTNAVLTGASTSFTNLSGTVQANIIISSTTANAVFFMLRNPNATTGAGNGIAFNNGTANTNKSLFSSRLTASGTDTRFAMELTDGGTMAEKYSFLNSGVIQTIGTTMNVGAAYAVVLTYPTASGTLATLAGSEALSNKTYAGSTLLLTGTFSGADNGLVSRNANSGGTNASYDFRFNTGGTFYSGVETSAGGTIFTGANPSTAYEVVLGNQANGNVGIFANNTRVVTFAASGATTFIGVVNATNAALTTPAFTGVPTGTVTGDVYTPTLTNTTNITASTAYACDWMRVGNKIFVSGSVDIDATLAVPTATQLDISLPIASNFAATTDVKGVVSTSAGGTELQIVANIAGDTASITYNALTGVNSKYLFSFSYTVQ